jgi:hypothetical protein
LSDSGHAANQSIAWWGPYLPRSLSRAIGDNIGQPLDSAHVDPATGDVLQPTSTGLAVYRAGSQVAIFTDGYRHGGLGRQGLVT